MNIRLQIKIASNKLQLNIRCGSALYKFKLIFELIHKTKVRYMINIEPYQDSYENISS